jgi:hypothetical protein
MSLALAVMETMIECRELDVADLLMGQKYNRIIKPDWCKFNAKDEEFDPHLMRPIEVSLRNDGKYYVVDGQNRVTMLQLRGIKKVWCRIHIGLTYSKESKLFVRLDESTRKIQAGQVCQALIEARDPEVLDIQSIVENYGFYLNLGNNKNYNFQITSDNQIRCVGGVRKLYKKNGRELLDKCFNLIKLSWDGEPDSLRKTIIESVMLFIKTYKEYGVKDSDLVKKWKDHSACSIILDANSNCKVKERSSFKPYGKELLRIYNSGRREADRLPDRF